MPTKNIITLDNTKISSYRKCPRKFLLRHHLGWDSIEQKPALAFGGALHEGMRHILLHYKDQDRITLLEGANTAFDNEWIERGFPVDDPIALENLYPRIPSAAHEMFSNWVDQNWTWLQGIEILDVEAPFAVALYPKLTCPYCGCKHIEEEWVSGDTCSNCSKPLTTVYIVGRRDATFRDAQGIWCLEHKTSSMYKKEGGFQSSFINGFRLDSQVDSYTYTARMAYGPEVRGAQINAISTNKYGKCKVFNRYTQTRTEEALYLWYREACHWIRRLLNDLEDPLNFHRNMEGCQSQYGFCNFHDLCRFYPNPWELEHPPIGYKVEHWEPFNQEELQEILADG